MHISFPPLENIISACRRTDDVEELPDHDYDFISPFQEGNLKSITGNPTAGDDASEVRFELTSCEAYGPVTVPMQDDRSN